MSDLSSASCALSSESPMEEMRDLSSATCAEVRPQLRDKRCELAEDVLHGRGDLGRYLGGALLALAGLHGRVELSHSLKQSIVHLERGKKWKRSCNFVRPMAR